MSAAYGPLTLRYGRVQDQLTLDSAQANALIAGVRQAGFVSLADDLAVADKKSMFAGYGAALDWHNATPVRAQFYTAVAGKDEAQVKAIWSKLVFTGKATPPKELPSSAEVVKAVAADPLPAAMCLAS